MTPFPPCREAAPPLDAALRPPPQRHRMRVRRTRHYPTPAETQPSAANVDATGFLSTQATHNSGVGFDVMFGLQCFILTPASTICDLLIAASTKFPGLWTIMPLQASSHGPPPLCCSGHGGHFAADVTSKSASRPCQQAYSVTLIRVGVMLSNPDCEFHHPLQLLRIPTKKNGQPQSGQSATLSKP